MYRILNKNIPTEMINKWQSTVDVIAEVFNVPAALIMRVHQSTIEVLIKSNSKDNPYSVGDKEKLQGKLFCETVIIENKLIYVDNAFKHEKWKDIPDINLGMTSYLGVPLNWPTGEIFGTICVLDSKPIEFNEKYRSLIWHFKTSIEDKLELLIALETNNKISEDLKLKNIQFKKLLKEKEHFTNKRFTETNKELAEEVKQRKQIEKELKNERDLSLNLFNTIKAIIICLNSDGCITLINESGCEILGYSEKEVLGVNWFKKCLPQPDGYENVYPFFLELISGSVENAEYFENYIQTKSGELRMIAWHNSLLRDENGNITGTLSYGADVTDQKKAEDNLRQNEERVKLAAENGNLGIWEINFKTEQIVFATDKWLEITGITHEKLKIFSFDFWLSLVHPDDLDQTKKTLAGISKGRNDRVENELRISHPQKGWIWLYAVVKAIERDENGIPIRVVGFHKDITQEKLDEYELQEEIKKRISAENKLKGTNKELKLINKSLEEQKVELESMMSRLQKTQQQLIQSEKMASIGVLTAGVAHEINNPVNYINAGILGLKKSHQKTVILLQKYRSIKPTTKLIKDIREYEKAVDIEKVFMAENKMFGAIQEGINQTIEIIKNLKSFSSSTREGYITVDINELIDVVLVMLHNQYKNRIEIIKKYKELPEVSCDKGKINQVIMNLLTNAIQAIENKGKITVRTKYNKEQKNVQLTITDSGKGIPKELQQKIYDPFFTTKDVGLGTGLGLYIVYNIIEQHNGKIEFKSTEKTGTEFNVYLPVSN